MTHYLNHIRVGAAIECSAHIEIMHMEFRLANFW